MRQSTETRIRAIVAEEMKAWRHHETAAKFARANNRLCTAGNILMLTGLPTLAGGVVTSITASASGLDSLEFWAWIVATAGTVSLAIGAALRTAGEIR